MATMTYKLKLTMAYNDLLRKWTMASIDLRKTINYCFHDSYGALSITDYHDLWNTTNCSLP